MCTLLSVSRELYDAAPAVIEHRIAQDALFNSDGLALFLADANGNHSLIRTMDVMLVVGAMAALPWQRAFLHCRMATQGATNLANTHGWSTTGGIVYMHNGILQDPEAVVYPVDSMLIGKWLDRGGIDYALSKLAGETFANTFLIDVPNNSYTVTRNRTGSLYTDGAGNYSSHDIISLGVVMPVPAGTVEQLPLTAGPPKLYAVGE